jgi:dihydroorotase (multifunctional complex type)
VTPDGTKPADIIIDEGRITALVPYRSCSGDPMIDAEDRVVLPGVIDSHVHVRDPGQTHKEDFASSSAAAAASGVTTIMCMPNTAPLLSDTEGFAATIEAARRSRVDFAVQALAHPGNLAEMAKLKELGVVSFEMFLAGNPDLLTCDRHDQMAIMREVAALDGVLGLYPGDPGIVAELTSNGPLDVDAIMRRQPSLLEAGALLQVLALAEEAGCRMHFRQMSSELSAVSVACARRRGLASRLTVEVTPHHLVLTTAEFRHHGAKGYIMPPLRETEDVDALWKSLGNGEIDAIGSDHAPHHDGEKADGAEDLSKCPPGFPGLETFLPVVLTEMRRRGFDENTFAAMASTNPARIFGLFPRKGVIAPGSDADLVVVEEDGEWPVSPSEFHSKAHYSPFAGYRARERAAMTLVRGTVVYDEGVLTGPENFGALVLPTRARVAA